jgi:hypothetical protein
MQNGTKRIHESGPRLRTNRSDAAPSIRSIQNSRISRHDKQQNQNREIRLAIGAAFIILFSLFLPNHDGLAFSPTDLRASRMQNRGIEDTIIVIVDG